MNNHILHQPDFAPIAKITKLDSDFERSPAQEKFSKQYLDAPRTTFADSKWDGKLGFKPEAYQWLTTAYRKGYPTGVAEKFDEQFSC